MEPKRMDADELKAVAARHEAIDAAEAVYQAAVGPVQDEAAYWALISAQQASADDVPALLAHVAALEAENKTLRDVAQGVVDEGWYRGNSNGADYCEWCNAAQEPQWKNAPERHASDCLFVTARALVTPPTEAELRTERDRTHG